MRLSSNPQLECRAEYADEITPATPARTVIDMHKVMKTGNTPRGVDGGRLRGTMLDVANWLPFAAETYGISRDVRDFVLTPTLIFATEIPNANRCAFPFEEMSKWNTGAGCVSYQSWKKKPTFVEHANNDPSIARGCIFDSSMKPMHEYVGGLHRVVLLNGWDRNRDAELVGRISLGRTGFSMGAWVEKYACSVCTADIHRQGCEHFDFNGEPRMREVGGQLVYRVARGVTGFECSSVRQPAYRAAMAEPIG